MDGFWIIAGILFLWAMSKNGKQAPAATMTPGNTPPVTNVPVSDNSFAPINPGGNSQIDNIPPGETFGFWQGPPTLNDGTYDYVLVRPAAELAGGLSRVALYERVPADPDYQFTPDLRFTEGLSQVPIMQPIHR